MRRCCMSGNVQWTRDCFSGQNPMCKMNSNTKSPSGSRKIHLFNKKRKQREISVVIKKMKIKATHKTSHLHFGPTQNISYTQNMCVPCVCFNFFLSLFYLSFFLLHDNSFGLLLVFSCLARQVFPWVRLHVKSFTFHFVLYCSFHSHRMHAPIKSVDIACCSATNRHWIK